METDSVEFAYKEGKEKGVSNRQNFVGVLNGSSQVVLVGWAAQRRRDKAVAFGTETYLAFQWCIEKQGRSGRGVVSFLHLSAKINFRGHLLVDFRE